MKGSSHRIYLFATVLFMLIATRNGSPVFAAAPKTGVADKIWQLEHSYWEYAKAHDVEGYRRLWREDFVGWPSSEPLPIHKDHIGDWVLEEKKEQHSLNCYKLDPAGIVVVKNVAVAHYRLTERWDSPNGKGNPRTIKVTHTWLKNGDNWQILGGMAAVIKTEPVCD